MVRLRELREEEIAILRAQSCFAEDWSRVSVSECFTPSQVTSSRFVGSVSIGPQVQIHNSTIANYELSQGARIEGVTRLECTTQSSFGNGVEVASLNECGGRTIKIYESLTAQVAYIYTTCRHRPKLIERLDAMVDALSLERTASMGYVGRNSSIVAASVIRNLRVGDSVKIEGCSILSNGTILDGGYFGADVKAHDFIAVEGARVDNGATIERCFVGENVILSNGFTAVDSLFFASSHCENGEAASVFAGPYTVSHHKSSLLIAGMFSFFNAGSGSNQSNHLFKCGPVHQAVHLRGCKFGSSAYVMLPAINGAYTSVIGSHSTHHDTSEFPFSYLINKEGRSTLIPAANLSSYGYQRDVEKWVKRDRRKVKRDMLNLEEYNPYISGMLLDAVNRTNILIEKSPDAQSYIHNKIIISSSNLHRGLSLYNKAVAASLGAMLSSGDGSRRGQGRCRWVDLAGQYISKSYLEELLQLVESSRIETLEAIDARLGEFACSYGAYAYDWALGILIELLGYEPNESEIASIVASATESHKELRAMAERDREKDSSEAMSISYGIDSDRDEDRMADFRAVRGL